MPRTLIPAQRHRKIREYLEIHQIVRSSMLSEMLGASEATIRRDLELLEKQGVVERAYGGAILTQRMPNEPAYANSMLAHPDEKRAIGLAAAQLVKDGDTIFVNSGTTASAFLHALSARQDLGAVTVVTNNVSVTTGARDVDFEVILLGGSFRPRSNSTVGRFADDQLRKFCASRAFIGVDGISLRYGCTTPSNVEADIAQRMIEQTRGPVVVITDHSKWGVISNYSICSVDQIHTLVADGGLAPDSRAELQAHSVEVIIAGDVPGSDGHGMSPD